MSTLLPKLSEYLDHLNAQLLSDYERVDHATKEIQTLTTDRKVLSEFEWLRAHIHRDMLQLHETIKQYQDAIRHASTKI